MDNLPASNRLVWFFCCDHFSTDRQDKASLIGVFDFFNFTALPSLVPRFFCVARLDNVVEGDIALIVVPPKGISAKLAEAKLSPQSKDKGLTLAWEIIAFTFTEVGQYVFAIEIDGHLIGAINFTVYLNKE